jgi:hypothetical protein
MTKSFNFRNGYRAAVDAQTTGQELERIRSHHGELTADLVVDESRPESAPLHSAFEWNDTIAAEEHRKHQARTMIRAIQVVNNDDPPEPIYVHIHSAGAYVPTDEVVKALDMYDEAYRSAQSRLAAAAHAVRVLARAAERLRPKSLSRIESAAASLQRAQDRLASAPPRRPLP